MGALEKNKSNNYDSKITKLWNKIEIWCTFFA